MYEEIQNQWFSGNEFYIVKFNFIFSDLNFFIHCFLNIMV